MATSDEACQIKGKNMVESSAERPQSISKQKFELIIALKELAVKQEQYMFEDKVEEILQLVLERQKIINEIESLESRKKIPITKEIAKELQEIQEIDQKLKEYLQLSLLNLQKNMQKNKEVRTIIEGYRQIPEVEPLFFDKKK